MEQKKALNSILDHSGVLPRGNWVWVCAHCSVSVSVCVPAGISSVSESSCLWVFVQAAEGPAPKVCPVPHQWAASAGNISNQTSSETKLLNKKQNTSLRVFHSIFLSSDSTNSSAAAGWAAVLSVHCHQHRVWSSRYSSSNDNKLELSWTDVHCVQRFI